MAISPSDIQIVSSIERLIDLDLIERDLATNTIKLPKEIFSKFTSDDIWKLVQESLINRYKKAGWRDARFTYIRSDGCSTSSHLLKYELYNTSTNVKNSPPTVPVTKTTYSDPCGGRGLFRSC